MKKLLSVIVCVLILCSCSIRKEFGNTSASFPDEETKTKICAFLLENFGRNVYETGTGILTCDLEGLPADTSIYPVYLEGRMVLLYIDNEEGRYIDDEELLQKLDDGRFIFIEAEKGVFLVTEKQVYVLKEGMPADMKKLDRLRECIAEENPLGDQRMKLKLPEEHQEKNRNDRIIVRFSDGDQEEKIRMYEEFCSGSMEMKYRSGNIYVFVFEPLNPKALQSLLKRSLELDYVLSASLDQENGMDNAPFSSETGLKE